MSSRLVSSRLVSLLSKRPGAAHPSTVNPDPLRQWSVSCCFSLCLSLDKLRPCYASVTCASLGRFLISSCRVIHPSIMHGRVSCERFIGKPTTPSGRPPLCAYPPSTLFWLFVLVSNRHRDSRRHRLPQKNQSPGSQISLESLE